MKKILVIDDQSDNLVSIQALLKLYVARCTIYTATSGLKGIELAKKMQPDAILLDIIMPIMDGYETCLELKKQATTMHIPIIMLTAIRTDIRSRVKGLECGADVFLYKPIDPIELSAQLRVVIRIKDAEDKLRAEKDLLQEMVEKRTCELQKSKEKYKAFYDNVPLSYQSLDNNGCFRDVNPAWLKTLGYQREEVLGKLFGNFLHPDYLAYFNKNFPQFKKCGHVHNVHFKILHKKGHYLDILFEGCAGYHPDGTFRQTYCVFQDITDRLQAEDNLRKLSAAVTQSSAIIIITDLDGNIEYVNPKFTELTGYTKEDTLGNTLRMLKTDRYPQTFYAELWQTISAGLVWRGELYNRKKNGAHLWESASISPIFNTNGVITNYIKISEDITEHKKAIEALKKSENNFSLYFKNLPVAAYRSTIEAPGKLLMVNQEFLNIFEYSTFEELKNLPIKDFYKDPVCRAEFITEVKEFSYVNKKELELVKKNGEVFWGLCSARLVHDEATNEFWVDGIIENISEQKKTKKEKELLEKQVLQSQKLETIGTLTGGIAHDFNNILMPIMCYSDMAMNELTPSDSIYEDIKEIHKASLRARDLIIQMLNFGRQANQERKAITLAPIITEAIKLIRPSLPSTISIQQNIQKNCGVILADAGKLHQVIVNLCTNAYHAMEKSGGKLSISLSRIVINGKQNESSIRLASGEYNKLIITDTGGGIKREIINKIFEPFFTTKEVGKGSGLGLAVVHGIIKSHDGEICVHTNIGEGTEFCIYLPIIDAVLKEEIAESKTGFIRGNGESIFVVDDEIAVTKMFARVLKFLGYNVTTTNSSAVALDVFQNNINQFDLIISDLTMPHLTGFDLAMQIRKINLDIPIIIVTGVNDEIDAKILSEMKINCVIKKPLQIISFSKVLQKIFSPKR